MFMKKTSHLWKKQSIIQNRGVAAVFTSPHLSMRAFVAHAVSIGIIIDAARIVEYRRIEIFRGIDAREAAYRFVRALCKIVLALARLKRTVGEDRLAYGDREKRDLFENVFSYPTGFAI